jgi:hypothetical protein
MQSTFLIQRCVGVPLSESRASRGGVISLSFWPVLPLRGRSRRVRSSQIECGCSALWCQAPRKLMLKGRLALLVLSVRVQAPVDSAGMVENSRPYYGLSAGAKYPIAIAVTARHAPASIIASPIVAISAAFGKSKCRCKILRSPKTTSAPVAKIIRPRSRKNSDISIF